jgi:hypothetical protein
LVDIHLQFLKNFNECFLRHSISSDTERCQIRADGGGRSLFCSTLDLCGWADRTRARSGLRALRGRRALDIRATRAGARRAVATFPLTGTAVNDDRLRLGNTALQNILAEVGHWRALRLQHILAHIGRLGARRDCGLEHIL